MNRKQRRASAKLGSTSGHSPAAAEAAALLETGLKYHQSGRLTDAEAFYQRALAAQPGHADALHLRGLLAYQLKRYDAAAELIGQAIEQNRRDPIYFSNLGAVLSDQGKHAEAVANFDQALALSPDHAEAFNNRGNALKNLRRFDDALASYDRALALKPDYAEAYNNRGNMLAQLKRFEEALTSFERAYALRPDSVALSNSGNALKELGRYDEALVNFDKALGLSPAYAEIINNRGNVLKDMGRLEEALASYDKAVALRPDYAEAFSNRGNVLTELRRFEEALASYASAVAADPSYAQAHWNEALIRLLTGDYERGWIKAEWRWKCPALGLPQRNFAQPLWLGAEPVDGKTILIHNDQGLGDALHFCRYVPLLAERGAHVIVEIQEPLRQLMSGLAGVSRCISKTQQLPEFDIHCSMGSLPLAFGTRLGTIPSVTPYLHAPADSNWEARLGRKERPRIGLVWSGNPRHLNDRKRSIALSTLSALFDVDATFVSLQKEMRPGDEVILKERNDILNVGPSLDHFADTAAVISHLDLVISVDTSVAHLAGALGRPVWILLPFAPDWRWLLDRDDSPWYPTARLFRQTESREWPSVVARLRDALCDFIEKRSPAGSP
jgi:tetratricopeptide (TPR) repeat protein